MDDSTRTEAIRQQLVIVGDQTIVALCQRVSDAYLAGDPLDATLEALQLHITARQIVKGA